MILNSTGLPHGLFKKLGPGGSTFEVFVLKASFDLDPGGSRLQLARTQRAVQLSDRYAGPESGGPLAQVVAAPGDAILFKPGSDVWVTGTACSEGGRLRRQWPAGIAVGLRRHIVDLFGPREWRKGLMGWRLSAPEPCASVALDYRLAFGGHWGAAPRDGAKPEFVRKPDNPAGCGWLPDANGLSQLAAPTRARLREQWTGLTRLPAPQILLPSQVLHHPSQAIPTAGLGPLARWWHPRTRYLGTRDQRWRAERYPDYPEDFDLRFFHAAPPALQGTEPLKGNERVAVMGMLPEGDRCWELPGIQPRLRAVLDDATGLEAEMRLDTLALDLDQRDLSLTWRVLFPPHINPREIEVQLPSADLDRIAGAR
jgi:hypothetical protein